ncbi:hypothetical protein BDN67DRAFT_968269 [Paxillus ammoniavirescens]|nr:hypothetical protein BDN67DRAFT_968269 [Paxillus ammoniavirescens]
MAMTLSYLALLQKLTQRSTRLPSTSRILRKEASAQQCQAQGNLLEFSAEVPAECWWCRIGLLFAFSLVSAFASYHLDEYKAASAALQASVKELQASTEKMRLILFHGRVFMYLGNVQVLAHVRRIETVEKDLKTLTQSSASKDDLSKVRAEVKKLYDGLHIAFLDFLSQVWGMQQDLHAIAKKRPHLSVYRA